MDRAAIEALAAVQRGLVARWQVPSDGKGPAELDRLRRSGRIVALARGIYTFPGHADSWRRRVWFALLYAGPGSVVSHQSAARLHGFEQFAPVVAVIVPGWPMRDPPGIDLHRLRDLLPGEVAELDGLPVTVPVRTMVDLGAVTRPHRLRLAVEQGILERRFTAAEVGAVLGRVRRRGKPGVAVVESVLDLVGPGRDLPRSELERLLDRAIDLAGLPAPRREHPLPSATGRMGFVDRCWPELRWIVEADGRLWHGRHQQMRADADRVNEAAALGHVTTRLLWEHLSSDPIGTAELLRRTYEDRRRLLHPPNS